MNNDPYTENVLYKKLTKTCALLLLRPMNRDVVV